MYSFDEFDINPVTLYTLFSFFHVLVWPVRHKINPIHIYVMVVSWLGMVSTKCLDVTDGSSNIVRWLLANSFWQALTPVLPTVVLVPFNHVTTLALAQLGIWSNYSNNLSLEIIKGAPKSPRQDGPANRVTRSFDWLGEADPVLPDWQNQSPGPLGLRIYTFTGGQGHLWS